jgi:hypothetical protein
MVGWQMNDELKNNYMKTTGCGLIGVLLSGETKEYHEETSGYPGSRQCFEHSASRIRVKNVGTTPIRAVLWLSLYLTKFFQLNNSIAPIRNVNVKDAEVGSSGLLYRDIWTSGWGTKESHVNLRKDIRPLERDRTSTTQPRRSGKQNRNAETSFLICCWELL